MLVMHAAHAPAFPVRKRTLRRTREVVVTILLAAVPLAAQSQKPAAPKTKTRLAQAIDLTIKNGHDAILPPHVSNLLGISPEEHETRVKQAVEMGESIRGLDVSTDEHNDVVVFVENRLTKETTFYLTSRRGLLRRVLSVREGVGYPRRPTKDDQDLFRKEKQYWLDRLVPKKP